MSLFQEANLTSMPAAKPAVRYRAINPLAVASVAAGVLSIATALHGSLAVIPVAGIVLGWRALRQIRNTPDEWTGLGLAQTGIGLSAALWVVGSGWLLFARASEIPYGYQPVSYESLQPDPNKPTEPIPQTALDMQDRKVFIRGYMQPRRQQTGIKDFILCPTNGECPFCIPNPKPTEKIRVTLQGDLETSYTTHPIGVAGRFRVNQDDPNGIAYGLDADQPVR
jgi:hypothetical protein